MSPIRDIGQEGYRMSQVDVERFLGRLITDADFRAKAAVSIIGVCHDVGISLTPKEKSFLSHIDFTRIGQLSDCIDDSIRRN
jgi:K+/H+ antiporter YhaU regulatory subunit KhtT